MIEYEVREKNHFGVGRGAGREAVDFLSRLKAKALFGKVQT